MHVYGTPGGSLKKARRADSQEGWATGSAARAGQLGEVDIARHLATEFANDARVHVFHDLRIPGHRANLDHAVVAGNDLLLLDTKRWGGGFYWTVAGCTFRGFERFKPADKATLPMAQRVFREQLAKQPSLQDVTVKTAMLVVPAGKGRIQMWAYRAADKTPVKVVRGEAGRWVARRVQVRKEPSADLLNLLRPLVIDQQAVHTHGQPPRPLR